MSSIYYIKNIKFTYIISWVFVTLLSLRRSEIYKKKEWTEGGKNVRFSKKSCCNSETKVLLCFGVFYNTASSLR